MKLLALARERGARSSTGNGSGARRDSGAQHPGADSSCRCGRVLTGAVRDQSRVLPGELCRTLRLHPAGKAARCSQPLLWGVMVFPSPPAGHAGGGCGVVFTQGLRVHSTCFTFPRRSAPSPTAVVTDLRIGSGTRLPVT